MTLILALLMVILLVACAALWIDICTEIKPFVPPSLRKREYLHYELSYRVFKTHVPKAIQIRYLNLSVLTCCTMLAIFFGDWIQAICLFRLVRDSAVLQSV